MKKNILLILTLLMMFSCGEEILTTGAQSGSTEVGSQQVTNLQNCAQMQLDKPPVDILYVLDNSGSTVSKDFQSIKSGITNTINSISNEFDYHIYITPLIGRSSTPITKYPLVVNDTTSLPSTNQLNIRTIDSLSKNDFFPQPSGGQREIGFERSYDIITSNRSNGIFRSNAHTIVVLVSTEDDDGGITYVGGNPSPYNQNYFNARRNQFLSLKNSPMNAETFRFISVVPFTNNCKTNYRRGNKYIEMSQAIYNTLAPQYKNDPARDTKNLCSNDINGIFTSVNTAIRSVVTGHKYDHWLISNATNGSQIQEDDITLTKVLSNGSQVNIPRSSSNGFRYLGYRSNQNTRYSPTVGAPVSGLVVRLNGNARVNYPECVIAQTKSPIEYYGWAVIQRQPIQSSIVVKVNGNTINKSNSNGWSYSGYFDSKNIKINHNGASNQPGVFKSGYFIQLHGSAIVSNGDLVEVFFTPAPIN